MEPVTSHNEDTPVDQAKLESRIEERLKLGGRANSSATWFYTVAGLSVVNSIIILFNGSWSFLFGLGVTQLSDGIVLGIAEEAPNLAIGAKVVGFGFVLLTAGLYVMFGKQAKKGKQWAYIVGMSLYALDGLIVLAIQDFLGVAFHVWVLFALRGGLKASKELKSLKSVPQVAAGGEQPTAEVD